MTDEPIITETHQRVIRRRFGRNELSALLEDAVMRQCGVTDDEPRKVEIRFEDETEGSPAYKVGTTATVTITIDLPKPKADPAD